ncbi:molybdenum ABC transporter ATP-binding protein [uncultured Maricaulis sp.]|uniref:molybdenum ABC transporter ATP-binding protein n=1 Tax=uncultured Maricaulis sp. TaxID=174710 RepID=UPI0026272298|nr:molybdenum ABC transporter ATP-binding protein [uncultured Maricaulis sp.]
MTLSVDLRHSFGDFSLDARFEAPAGITVLFGRSGAGKSSLAGAVAGLFRPEAARISLDGETLVDTQRRVFRPPHRRRVGCVFQDGRLFPHLNVRQNLLYGHRFASGWQAEARDFDPIVEMLGLEALLERGTTDLSGGERQRVALGRALLSKPRLLIADEPLAALDEGRKADILPYFERLRDELGIPVLYVSHSASEVARLASRVIVLEAGRVIGEGRAEDVLAAPGLLPGGDSGVASILGGRVRTRHADGVTEVEVGGLPLFLSGIGLPAGTTVRLRVRASDVMISLTRPEGLSALNIIPGIVERVMPGDGSGAIVRLRAAAGTILARLTRRSIRALNLSEGTACHAVIKSLAIAEADIARSGPQVNVAPEQEVG